MKCAALACPRKAFARGWCQKHYDRWRNHGDPNGEQPTIYQRFERQYIPEPNSGCWLWIGTTVTRGYGQISARGIVFRAHRLSWELHRGLIPEHSLVLHRCDTPSCVNPDHLFLGSHRDNMSDKISKGREAHGQKHGNAILTEADVVIIKKRLSNREPHRRVAHDFGVSESAISHIAAGHTWGWL